MICLLSDVKIWIWYCVISYGNSLISVLWIIFTEKFEKLLNMLMDFNDSIRFAVVCDKDGEILWNSQRKGLKNIVPLADTKKTLKRAINAWQERANITDKVG